VGRGEEGWGWWGEKGAEGERRVMDGRGEGRTEVKTRWGQGRDKRKRRREERGRRELKGR